MRPFLPVVAFRVFHAVVEVVVVVVVGAILFEGTTRLRLDHHVVVAVVFQPNPKSSQKKACADANSTSPQWLHVSFFWVHLYVFRWFDVCMFVVVSLVVGTVQSTERSSLH